MKKLLALMLAAALALSLVACGGGNGAGDTNTPSGNKSLPANDLDTVGDIYNWLVGDVWNHVSVT
jgi:hypothetical protein